jgi:hypothetical protein
MDIPYLLIHNWMENWIIFSFYSFVPKYNLVPKIVLCHNKGTKVERRKMEGMNKFRI